jgi:hypothetical protein
MKTIALFLVLALAILAIGCEEAGMKHYAANPVATANPNNGLTAKVFVLSERQEIVTPDGMEGFVAISGLIRYEITKTVPAVLPKKLPAMPIYNVSLTGEGEIDHINLTKATTLAKPSVWTFKGKLVKVAQEGADITATFDLDGTNYAEAQLRLVFRIEDGDLVYTGASFYFRGGRGE